MKAMKLFNDSCGTSKDDRAWSVEYITNKNTKGLQIFPSREKARNWMKKYNVAHKNISLDQFDAMCLTAYFK